MNKITSIIQARMDSARLPGKTLMNIGSKMLMERVIDRVLKSKMNQQIVLATTDLPIDNELVEFVKHKYSQISIYRGETEDVLKRYLKAAILFNADPIVRITADDPFKDPNIIDQIIKLFSGGKYDYVSNTIKHTYPEGLDVEIFSLEALKKANKKGKNPKDREHVTYFIWNHPELFRLKNLPADKDYSSIRLTVDYAEDIKLSEKIYNYFAPREDFSFHEIIRLLQNRPELLKINQHIERYESLKK